MPQRPDLTDLPEEVIAYITDLESRLEALEGDAAATARDESQGAPLTPAEEPTTINVISISAAGVAKRTPRHLYARQRRGGMGIFDLDAPASDPPAFLLCADIASYLTLLTNQGRAFRVAVADIVEGAVRSKGQSIVDRLPLRADERLAVIFADRESGFLCLVTEHGQMRRFATQYVGKSMAPGTVLQDPRDGGAPAAACWSRGNDEIVLATVRGRGIRFSERLIPVRGCLGMRVEPGDRVAAIAAAPANGAVFLASDDGKGALRPIETFAANKAPGSGGKALMKTDHLIGGLGVAPGDDLFLISRLGKLIRFDAGDVPPKEGPVQGVNCMALRADSCVAVMACPVPARNPST